MKIPSSLLLATVSIALGMLFIPIGTESPVPSADRWAIVFTLPAVDSELPVPETSASPVSLPVSAVPFPTPPLPADTPWIGKPTVSDTLWCVDSYYEISFDAGGDYGKHNVFEVYLVRKNGVDAEKLDVVLGSTGGKLKVQVGPYTLDGKDLGIIVYSTLPRVESPPSEYNICVPETTDVALSPQLSLLCSPSDSVRLEMVLLPRREIRSILWSTGDTTRTITVNREGVYTAEVELENGCTVTSTQAVVFHSNLPKPRLNAASGFLCDGDTLDLYVETSGFEHFRWSNGDDSFRLSVTEPGSYWVEATYTDGCTAVSDTIDIVAAPLPPVPTIVQEGDRVRTDAEAATYQWYLDGKPLAGATMSSHRILALGTYSLVVGNEAGCERTSESLEVFSTGVENRGSSVAGEAMSAIPDGEAGQLLLTLPTSGTGTARLRISDMRGGTVLERMVDAHGRTRVSVALPDLPSGAYMATLSGVAGDVSHEQWSVKFIWP